MRDNLSFRNPASLLLKSDIEMFFRQWYNNNSYNYINSITNDPNNVSY